MDSKICFEKAVVLGSGKLAYQCAAKTRKYIPETRVIEYRVTESTVLRKLCEKDNLPYQAFDRRQLTNYLEAEQKKTLVVSAGNTYLVPDHIVDRQELTIINWHNALLPAHKGRNAEAWSIYEGDKISGITWHMLTREVDAGDIIAVRQIEIEDTMTALRLFQKQCEAGAEVYASFLERFLLGKSQTWKQSADQGKMHFSSQIPNDGYLDVRWEAAKMSCFLRAMDYGSLRLLGEMHVCWGSREYAFSRYSIEECQAPGEDCLEQDRLVLYRDGKKITLKNLK